MLDRLLPIELFRGHWKALSDYREKAPVADTSTRVTIVLVPVVAFGLMFIPGAGISAPGALLAGVALLAGSFLSAWGQVSSLRLKLTDRAEDYKTVEQIDRDSLDETAAHLLVASIMSGATALWLVLGMNFATDPDGGSVRGLFAALATGFAVYVLLVFLIAVPRLYNAYVNINKVRDELSGTHRGR